MYRTKEQRLIAKIQDWTQERLIGDDCAMLAGGELLSMDTLVEGTHFLLEQITWEDLGWKSIAVNLSDLAAMAGRPRCALISLTLPEHVNDRDVEKMYRGILDCALTYRCRVVGGDLTAGRQVSVSVAVLGITHEEGVLFRGGAKPGDAIVVTGDFGASAACLKLLHMMPDNRKPPIAQHLLQKHYRPLPRLCESWALVRCSQGRGALMDASDGLADALVQISAASKVAMFVEEEKIPIAHATRLAAQTLQGSALDWALYGGEDYELVGTVAPEHWPRLEQACPGSFHRIGVVSEGDEVVLGTLAGKKEIISLERTFQHWR